MHCCRGRAVSTTDRATRPVGASVRDKLALMVTILVTFSVIIVSGVTSVLELTHRYERLRADSLLNATILAELSVFAVYTRSRQDLQPVFRVGKLQRDNRFLAFWDNGGRLIASEAFHGDEPAAPAKVPDPDSPWTATIETPPSILDIFRGGDIVVVAPVLSPPLSFGEGMAAEAGGENRAIGHLQLVISLTGLRERLAEDLSATVFGVLLFLLLTNAATVIFTRRMLAPLSRLANMADRIAGGELGIEVDAGRDLEMQHLGDAFNRMSARLREAQDRLKAYNRDLELKIAERTRELQNAARHAYQLAQHDTLTGLANRTLLLSRLHLSVAIAARRGDKIAVIHIGINGVESALRLRSREAADNLLRALAARLLACVRSGDTVARHDHGEFVLVVGDISGAGADNLIAGIVDNVLKALQSPFDIHFEPVRVDARIGVAIYPDDDVEPRMLLAGARETMLAAPSGSAAAYFSKDVQSRMTRRDTIAADLLPALASGEMKIRLHPVLRLKSHDIVRCQADVEWHHPRIGVILPGEFMPIAEHSGSELNILQWQIAESVKCAAGIERARALPLDIRLSRGQYAHRDLIDTLTLAIKASGQPPGRFNLLIAEEAAGADIGISTMLLRELKRIGVQIAVDEYGSGYGNLSDLARLPLDAISIDRTFIAGIAHSVSDRAVLRAYIGMAHGLGMRAIATGVTKAMQMAFLEEQNCDEATGPYIDEIYPGWAGGPAQHSGT